jgi:hypothetical protein
MVFEVETYKELPIKEKFWFRLGLCGFLDILSLLSSQLHENPFMGPTGGTCGLNLEL